MRFSIATALLLAAAIAAPVHEVEKRAGRVDGDDSLTVRGLLYLFPRFPGVVVPLKPKPVVAPKPVPHDPSVDPIETKPDPLQPSKNEPVTNPKDPDSQSPSVRLGTDPPTAKPKPVDACSRKRGCTPKAGSDPILNIDGKYDREIVETARPDGQYLKEAGFKDDGKCSLEEKWVDDMVKNQGYNDQEAKNVVADLIDDLRDGPHSEFMTTSHNMKKGDGIMVAESSYNRDYDLHRSVSGKTENGKSWTRPAIEPENSVRWEKQAMDNLRVAARAQEGVSVKDLRHIARHNIETEETKNILFEVMGGQPGQKTFTEASNKAEVDKIKPTLHATTTNALLERNAQELGGLKITQYRVWFDGSRFDMIIDVAP